ncbi:MAG: EthD family reductase [Rubrobacteraceae bacterium]
MIKVIFILYRKEGMSGDEFRDYWKNIHAPIAKRIPGFRGYVQNHALPDAETGEEPEYSGFADLYFDSPEALQAGLDSPEGQETLADVPNFCDPERTTSVVVEEVKVI